MTALTLSHAGLVLVAAPEDAPEPRTVEGILVPWNEAGRTNLGRGVQVMRAALTVPDKVVGITGHNREAPVSRLVAHEDRPEGLWGRLRVAPTPAGDLLLAEVRAGVRDGLSVEVEVTETDAAGNVTAGRLDFVAHVPVGAFDSARVHSLAATLNTQTGAPVTTPVTPAAPAAPEAPATLAGMTPEQFQAVLVAGLAQLQAGAHVGGGEPSAAQLLGMGGAPQAPGGALAPAADPITEAARLQAQLALNPGDATLKAALQDVTASGMPLFQQGTTRLGEKLWSNDGYTRKFVGLMRRKELKSMRYYGWRWTQTPKVVEWAGDKTPITGNPVQVEQVPFDARRCAGGWDVDRKYKDFGDEEFWTEFYAEQVISYKELSDEWAAEHLADAALDVSNDANLATLPADYAALIDAAGVPAGPTQLLKAAAIGRVILENTPKVKQGPDYVLVNPIDWLTLIDLTNLDLPAFLTLLKVSPENFMPAHQVAQGAITLGVRNAASFRELGPADGVPIRVEALDVARGGIDSAVYGYVGTSTERPGGIISVPLAAAA